VSLSERVRPDCEAAPWVIKEIIALEQQLTTAREHTVERLKLSGRVKELEAAILKDVSEAGPTTGPIYHKEVRKVMGLSAEGSGPLITGHLRVKAKPKGNE